MKLNNICIPVWVVFCQLMSLECQRCPGIITDPLWNQQWYLLNLEDNKHDMNVMPAWERCIDGTGIIVGVVDLGVDDHEDLLIDRNISVPYQLPKPTPYPNRGWFFQRKKVDVKTILRHGTRVAGIIAGRKNDIGVIGIAFGAKIADIKIGSKKVFATFDSENLHHRSDVIDVYSCSFSNFHTGTRTYPLTQDQERALNYGVTQGRNGLGSIYVFASGNSGGEDDNLFRDSCAYDRLITNRYVIAVAGVQHNMEKLPSGEECSAMMIAAFTAKPGPRNHSIVTTDIHNNYTSYLDQSSAAAPMVSGAVALALQEKPGLTYRDIMHLLVRTAKNDYFDQTYFKENAAKFKVSSAFGFGLLDIGNLVETSRTWKNVPARQICNKNISFNMPTNQNNFVLEIAGCDASYVEHVEVSLKVNNQNAGQIRWILISPYGTKSIILPGRGLDPTKKMDLTVLTVQMWGENPNGYWRLQAEPVFGAKLENCELQSANLLIHGYDCTINQQCLRIAEQVEAFWGDWTRWSRCNCDDGTVSRQRLCNRPRESDYCIGASFERMLCSQQDCPITTTDSPSWNEWSQWSSCPTPCSDNSLQRRSRYCSRGRCQGDATETKQCPPCIDNNSPSWNEWSQWLSCPTPCSDNSLQLRSRFCSTRGRCRGDHTEIKQCPPCIDNNISQLYTWSQWSSCSVSCGYGSKFRTRQCSGDRCNGNYRERSNCIERNCPTECIDSRPDCPELVDRDGCMDGQWNLENCPKSCNRC